MSIPRPPTSTTLQNAGRTSAIRSSPFLLRTSECDDVNVPPALSILLRSMDQLTSYGADIRGKFVDHARLGGMARVAHEIGRATAADASLQRRRSVPALTPLSAHCLGRALAELIQDNNKNNNKKKQQRSCSTICIGVDPRPHSMCLADAFARGAESLPGTRVYYTGLATTPACASFLYYSNDISSSFKAATSITTTAKKHIPPQRVDASVMVTASHLPVDRNGFKIFLQQSKEENHVVAAAAAAAAAAGGGLMSREQLRELGQRAKTAAADLFTTSFGASVPPTSGINAVMCSEWVDWMPEYAETLKQAILKQYTQQLQQQLQQEPQNLQTNIQEESSNNRLFPLKGLSIVLNAGNGSGGFFAQVLKELGADVSGSIHLQPDPTFPNGIPNPEYAPMMDETIRACQVAHADLGIMLDTDADRCGFIVPTSLQKNEYEALNRNRLIALVGVMFATSVPGCTIVTDSVTSEGLTTFLQDHLGLQHVRYIKGYANVIHKAKELTTTNVANAQVAIETSGHCAMQENRYLDDGTYTAAKVVSLLASNPQKLLRDWIADYQDLSEVCELRMTTFDKSLLTTEAVFDFCAMEIEQLAAAANTGTNTNPATFHNDNNVDIATTASCWQVDTDNLDGIRVRIGDGQFFMLRRSLHDPIISLQIEAHSKEMARKLVVAPLLQLFESSHVTNDDDDDDDDDTASYVSKVLDLSVLHNY